jgi:hypothetical protein
MILIGSKFKVSSSLSFILHSTSTILKAKFIMKLSGCMILIGSKFEVSSSIGLVLHNASPVRKADPITFLS